MATHGEVAYVIAEGRADAGMAIATVAHNYDLGFRSLGREPYDLVVTSDGWDEPQVQGLMRWLAMQGRRTRSLDWGGIRRRGTGQG